jgi:putative transposase
VTPAARRRALRHLVEVHRCSERWACGLVGLARSVARYRPRRRDDAELRARCASLPGSTGGSATRLHALLRREGLVINGKKTYRLYRTEDLAVRRRRPRRRPPERERLRLVVPARRNQRWLMDFANEAPEPPADQGEMRAGRPVPGG